MEGTAGNKGIMGRDAVQADRGRYKGRNPMLTLNTPVDFTSFGCTRSQTEYFFAGATAAEHHGWQLQGP